MSFEILLRAARTVHVGFRGASNTFVKRASFKWSTKLGDCQYKEPLKDALAHTTQRSHTHGHHTHTRRHPRTRTRTHTRHNTPLRHLPSVLTVKVIKFKQARLHSDSNHDSPKVAQCSVIQSALFSETTVKGTGLG